MSRTTKIYISANYDGKNQAMTAAGSLSEAARNFGISAHTLKLYGCRVGGPEDEAAYKAAGGTGVLYRPIQNLGPRSPWRAKRYTDADITKIRAKAAKAADDEPDPGPRGP